MRLAWLMLLGAACGAVAESPYGATGDRAAVLAALDGFDDPVAAALRAGVTERGTWRGGHEALLAAASDCEERSEKSFVVLSNLGYLPKTVITRCADDAAAASRLFVALPGGDDHSLVHVASWDATAGAYRTYSLAPARDTPRGELAVEVQPGFCLGCHGGPHDVGAWQPLMNEMTNPWSQWNAAPGFVSQLFDERAAGFRAPGRLASASELEPIVRAGIERFVGARLRARGAAGTEEAALAMLRPLFCDETVNFVSEIHGGGELRASVVVDEALRLLVRQLRPARWAWLEEPTLTLPPGDPLTLVPVRGTSTIEAELGLVARGVITAEQALAVRAVDWERPVFSESRCGLWRGAGRGRAPAGTVEEMARGILADLALPPIDVDALGEAVALRHASVTRAELAAERRARACRAVAEYPTAPLYDDLDCD